MVPKFLFILPMLVCGTLFGQAVAQEPPQAKAAGRSPDDGETRLSVSRPGVFSGAPSSSREALESLRRLRLEHLNSSPEVRRDAMRAWADSHQNGMNTAPARFVPSPGGGTVSRSRLLAQGGNVASNEKTNVQAGHSNESPLAELAALRAAHASDPEALRDALWKWARQPQDAAGNTHPAEAESPASAGDPQFWRSKLPILETAPDAPAALRERYDIQQKILNRVAATPITGLTAEQGPTATSLAEANRDAVAAAQAPFQARLRELEEEMKTTVTAQTLRILSVPSAPEPSSTSKPLSHE